MQDWQLYEYAIIRIVPRVERGEFINAGVLLYCKKEQVLICKTHLSIEKLKALDPETDLDLIQQHLLGFERIATGAKSCKSPIAALDKALRFRWLSSTRSTMVQCSPIHPGYAQDMGHAVDKLMAQLVL
ncbi:DUF3037 domain-containing protein [Taibaiella sp. KBW10]|uniref:DUF3037 domain-containing protein n=1 Tax=Taibaiella sp. KBW10 TaxID=2153357 RepID=UPI000F5AF676|nr:DUF3037 domain-containing protein [Taibaiella sp. KBW10]RQO31378.1 DUF3037 domain-containing protein [Taibaiella sp. KBW10]